MIGNGIDIIEIDRIQEACLKWSDRFLNRIYTQQEQNYCRGRFPQLAARFAAKEAMMKSLGTGKRGLLWVEIEVVRERGRAPTIVLHGNALSIAENQNIKEMKFIKPLFFFPFVINLVVVGLIFSWFYLPKYGFLDLVFRSLGLEPIAFLAEESLATYAIIFAFFWPSIAYTMIIYLTGLTNVNREIVEAGRIDGAMGFKMFWYVILPQLKPATFIATVVTVVGALRSFDMVAIMTKGGPWGSSSVLAYKMYEEALFSYRMGYGSAIATVLFTIMMFYILFFIYRMYRNEREDNN